MNPTTEQMRQELANREPVSAMGRAAAGQAGANLIKRQPQVKASEALGQAMEKGFKKTTTTQADRTKVGGGNIGGGAFSAISEAHPDYEGKVWGVMDSGTASRLTNLTDPETAWTTMLGSATQLKTNPIVFGKLRRAFLSAMKEGKMTPELLAKFNHNLALTFGQGADIRDPKIWDAVNTFEKRAAMADFMMGQGIAPKKGGVAMGGEKSGKGVIFRPTDILKGETERSLMHEEHGGDVPTFAAGPRLFSLSGTHEQRPDLHPGFPTLLHGKDLGHNVKPTPTEVYLPDWHAKFKADNPARYFPHKSHAQSGPGYYDLALGVKGEGLPSQALNDPYIRHLIREGYAEGGEVSQDEMLAHTILNKAIGGPVQPDNAAGESTDVGYYEGGPSDGAGMDPMQYRAAGGLIRPTRIGVDEAPAMPIKLYMPPGRGEGMPVGGVDFQPLQPGQQMTPEQPPQDGQQPGGPAPGGPAPQGGPQSNILQMTPQGQAMSAMRSSPPTAMKEGGAVKTTAQMKAAMLYKADGGSIGSLSGNGISSLGSQILTPPRIGSQVQPPAFNNWKSQAGKWSNPSQMMSAMMPRPPQQPMPQIPMPGQMPQQPMPQIPMPGQMPQMPQIPMPQQDPFAAGTGKFDQQPLVAQEQGRPRPPQQQMPQQALQQQMPQQALQQQTPEQWRQQQDPFAASMAKFDQQTPLGSPVAMKKGGKVELTTAQMKAALRNKKANGGFENSKISDIGMTERAL